jgi:hypothetical protein
MARAEDTCAIRDALLGARLRYGDVMQAGARLRHRGGLLR